MHCLFIESYDSFSFNVQRLLEQQLDGTVQVTTIHNDTFTHMDDLVPHLPQFDCIVVGPGPGNPMNSSKEIGILADLFQHESVKNIPVLGICLGMQIMCLSQGARIEQLHTIKHGQVYDMRLTEQGKQSLLFDQHPTSFKSTRYHSLHVIDTQHQGIIPLVCTDDENGQLLMSCQINDHPWYAVQYHPESCCSQFGDLLLTNFLNMANNWNKLDSNRYQDNYKARSSNFTPLLDAIDRSLLYDPNSMQEPHFKTDYNLNIAQYQFDHIVNDPKLTLNILDKLQDTDKFVLASSSLSPNRGEWSIIALPDTESKVFTYYQSLNRMTLHNWQADGLTFRMYREQLVNGISNKKLQVIHQHDKTSFWKYLAEFMEPRKLNHRDDLPFIGGLIGILGYEMGEYVQKQNDDLKFNPDAKFVFINNSILINHQLGIIYLVSLQDNFPTEVEDLFLQMSSSTLDDLAWPLELPKDIDFQIDMPTEADYAKAFHKCQKYMHQGYSYEMCLTTQTKITPSVPLTPWRILQTLVQRNPAPFTSFLQFNDLCERYPFELCLVSTSPERFMKWDRTHCELRPIKGTVKKGKDMTFDKAREILHTPKEFGENLMILDLIRNDLYELIPDVKVEEFMSVEEYSTVYQLVSVVKAYGLDKSKISGIDLLKHTLPPGSMTGAPKKITVELLQDEIENELNKHTTGANRGIYSGVTGYWSLNDRADWSVNIRCMYSYNSGETWNIGAGGAITVLSSLAGEQEEMFTKLESALQVFQK